MAPGAPDSTATSAQSTTSTLPTLPTTLPTSLRVATDRLGIPPEIANFVLTVGATGNQNGTALYEGVVVLFLAVALARALRRQPAC